MTAFSLIIKQTAYKHHMEIELFFIANMGPFNQTTMLEWITNTRCIREAFLSSFAGGRFVPKNAQV
jgi:hypothetical protein